MGRLARFKPKKRTWLEPPKPASPVRLVHSDRGTQAEPDDRKRLSVYRQVNEIYQEKHETPDLLMRGILDIAVGALEAEGGSLWVVPPGTKKIECRSAVGPGSEILEGVRIPFGKGVVGWVVDERRSTVVEDTSKDPRFYDKVDRKQKFSTRTLVASPLVYSSEVIGVLEIVNKTDETAHFQQKDITFLEDICTPIAMHLKSSIMRQQQSLTMKRMESFAELHQTFCSTLQLESLLQLVLNRAISLVGAEVGSVWLTGERQANQDVVTCHVAEGPTRDKVIGLGVKKGQGIIGWSVEHLEPTIVEDCSKDARFAATIDKKIDFVTRSMIVAPLHVKDDAIGAIQIINKRGEGQLFSREDLDLLVLFANSAAMYIKNARLFSSEQKAKELAALIDISKQITATLDLDSVLMTIVNLASDIAQYEQAAISIIPPGRQNYEVRALSGIERIDAADPAIQRLNVIHQKIFASGKELRIDRADVYEKEPGAIPELVAHLKEKGSGGFFGCPLSDDQGGLGILTMDFREAGGMNDSKREMLSILINQCTVAIRNATLYTIIPSGNFWTRIRSTLQEKIEVLRKWSRRKQLAVATAVVLGLSALVFLKLPFFTNAQVELLPIAVTSYAEMQGIVAEVLVREGQRVKTGDTLVRLDVSDLRLQLEQKLSAKEKALAEMIKFQIEDRAAEFKIKEKEVQAFDAEIALLNRQLAASEVRSSCDGVVISTELDRFIGMPVSYGQELVKIAKTGETYVQFQIPEADADGIQVGNRARFKLYGIPDTTFSEGVALASVAGEGRQLNEASPERFFTALATVKTMENGSIVLRAGMTGKGKVYAGDRSIFESYIIRPLAAFWLKLFY
ncbi:MAG TPA: GAF domain-containing protein [Bdellovibrionota bacterium]|nr:GAF domain-containing protein [Bdellovibrionota bacterium]